MGTYSQPQAVTHAPHLARAHGAAVALQHPDLTTVLHLAVVLAVPCAVLAVRTAAVVPAVQVEADGVVGAAVPPGATLVDICTGGERQQRTRGAVRTGPPACVRPTPNCQSITVHMAGGRFLQLFHLTFRNKSATPRGSAAFLKEREFLSLLHKK